MRYLQPRLAATPPVRSNQQADEVHVRLMRPGGTTTSRITRLLTHFMHIPVTRKHTLHRNQNQGFKQARSSATPGHQAYACYMARVPMQ